MQVFKIDSQGFYIEPVIIDETKIEIPIDCVATKPPNGLYRHRHRWTGTEWVEGLTQAEIDAKNNVPKEPTAEEKLQAQIDTMQGALDFIILNY